MQQERVVAGTVAAIMAAGASTAYGSGNVVLGTVFALVALAALVATFARLLPGLNRLPLVGAPPPPKVRFHLEGETGRMTFDMGSKGPADVVLCAGVLPEGRRDEITRVLFNAYVVGATDIARCRQDGSPYPNGGHCLKGPDAPYWADSGVTIPLGALLLFFKVTIPEPGDYDVVLTFQSPDFYDKGDHFYRDTLIARRPAFRGGASDLA